MDTVAHLNLNLRLESLNAHTNIGLGIILDIKTQDYLAARLSYIDSESRRKEACVEEIFSLLRGPFEDCQWLMKCIVICLKTWPASEGNFSVCVTESCHDSVCGKLIELTCQTD